MIATQWYKNNGKRVKTPVQFHFIHHFGKKNDKQKNKIENYYQGTLKCEKVL